jgi:dephospho-CoA kinase
MKLSASNNNYKNKYVKYKNKIVQFGGTFNKNFIFVDGTSSAGKTTICTYFNAKGYKCLVGDDYSKKTYEKITEYKKTISNDYMPKNKMRSIYDISRTNLIIDDAIQAGNAMIDWVDQKTFVQLFEERGLAEQLYIIVVYTSLQNLARNLESRRKEGDPRGVFAFEQFAKRYVKAEENDNKIIDTVNRAQFKQILLDNFKYEFENENELNIFCNKIFGEMGISDDENHSIKLRPELHVDYLLNTHDKTKEDIYGELDKIFSQ